MNTVNSTRITLLFFIFCGAYATIGIHLYRIQIINQQWYRDLGNQQYAYTQKTRAPRALIFDRSGTKPLAMNRQVLSAFITPNKLTNKKQVELFLNHNYPHASQRLATHPHSAFMFVKRNVPENEQQIIADANIPDLCYAHETQRYYPLISVAQLIGITDTQNNGIMGLELMFNQQLAGTPTIMQLRKDARSDNFHFAHTQTQDGINGTPLVTSIDSTLQFLAGQEVTQTMKQFNAKQGAALIINPHTGEIITLVSQPYFDPNNRNNLNISSTQCHPLTQMHELGSVMKVFTALAALEEGVVTIDEPINCHATRSTRVNGRTVNTAPGTQAGIIPFCRVIEKSNNIGIAKVALRLNEKMYDHLHKMHFDTPTGTQFPGERAGFINHPTNWSKQSPISLSYGYEISITLAQLARAFCIIARNGHDIELTLLKTATNFIKSDQPPLYSPESIELIRTILHNTTTRGTMRRAQIKGYTIMSKSGTANILENGTYNDKRNIYSCAGIIEKGSYQRVIVVYIQEADRPNLFASQVAAPLFERIAQKTLIHNKILA